MSVPSQEIGWSVSAKLLREIIKKLDEIIKIASSSSTVTTTTTIL
ncbi:MAG: hypothetical protein BWY21_00627 [Parcubacteria group bacterium ADurb.Bin216]|jgi:hypothetical protein|nr:MAG: hypothetical protein BWY21_00627 [Parcubacteria group bacterium ADurb.Bin216]